MNRLVPAVLLLALALTAALPPTSGSGLLCDGNNDAGSGRDGTPANPVPVEPGLYDGCISMTETARPDWYRIDAGPGEQVAFTFTWNDCESVSVALYRLHPDGTRQHRGSFSASRGCPSWTVSSGNWETAMVYLAEISLLALPQGNPYTVEARRGIDLALTCLPADDLGSGRDARNDDPVPVSHDDRGTGCIDDVDDADFYLLHMDRPGLIHVDAEVDGNCNYFDVYFYNADHGEEFENLTHLDVAYSWECRDLAAIFEAREAGLYVLRISAVTWRPPSHIDYALFVRLHAFTTLCGGQDDHGSGRDATPAAPVAAAIDTPIHGCVDEGDEQDHYVLQVPPGAYEVKISAEGCRQPFVGVDRDGDGRIPYAVKYDCRNASDYYHSEGQETWTLMVFADERSKEWMGAYTIEVRRCDDAPPLLGARYACPVSDAVGGARSLLTPGPEATCARGEAGFRLDRPCPANHPPA